MAFNETPSGGYFFPQSQLTGGVVTEVSGGATKMEVLAAIILSGHVARGELPTTTAEQIRISRIAVQLAAAIGAEVTAYETT